MHKLSDRVALSLALASSLASSLVTPARAGDATLDGTVASPAQAPRATDITWLHAPTPALSAGGVDFAYRELGRQHVIVFDNRGVGASTGAPANSIEQMAEDAVTFIKASGFGQVDLFGFSMGRMVAQEIALKEPRRVRRMILAGTGPAGGEGISAVAGVEAGKAFLARLNEHSEGRDKDIAVRAYVAQLQALDAWGRKKPVDLSVIGQPVLVINGDDDRMVPTPNSRDLARQLPNSSLVIYPDAGHGGVFQYHADFVPRALQFLAR